ncbi:hypothetical protein [Streptomyces sp. NPDC003996]
MSPPVLLGARENLSGTTKNWTCKLLDQHKPVLQSHSGAFTGSSCTTPTYYYTSGTRIYTCVRAQAGYNDGSASASDEICG